MEHCCGQDCRFKKDIYILDSTTMPFLELPYALNPPALGFLGLVAPKLVAQY